MHPFCYAKFTSSAFGVVLLWKINNFGAVITISQGTLEVKEIINILLLANFQAKLLLMCLLCCPSVSNIQLVRS